MRKLQLLSTTIFAGISLLAAPAVAQDAAPAADNDTAVSEVVVTGTLIRGVAPVGTNVIGVSSETIEKSGLSNPIDLLGSVQLEPTFNGLYNMSGWGLAMRRVAKDTNLPEGAYGWSGAFGTHFWVDPKDDLVAVGMTNLSNSLGAAAPTARELEKLVAGTLPDRCSATAAH